MDIVDSILPESVGGATKDISSYISKGLAFVNLSLESVENVGKKFTEIFEHNRSSRNGLTMVYGTFFAIGSKDHGNNEWREHAASSIRELLHKWKSNDAFRSEEFKNTFGNKEFPTVKTNPNKYITMTLYYSYFSCICHHEASDIIICARHIDGEKVKAGADSEEDFLKKVEQFFIFFDHFFNQYTGEKK